MKIPPLNPLKVFEVVARTGNLTLAASELNVSQSAVSRQVAVLEEYLGVQLFTRERVGVRLTEVGEGYARRIGPAFGEIAAATEAITRKYSNNVIRLRTYTTLTARWLIPRLPHFKARHPEVEVSILNSTAPLDFGAEQCDLAIVLGDGHWPGAEAALLLEDIVEPVCAPGFIAEGAPPEALRGKRLLVSKYRKDDWPRWLAHAGCPSCSRRPRPWSSAAPSSPGRRPWMAWASPSASSTCWRRTSRQAASCARWPGRCARARATTSSRRRCSATRARSRRSRTG